VRATSLPSAALIFFNSLLFSTPPASVGGFLASPSASAETVLPSKALRVTQVCGRAIFSNQEMDLRREAHGPAVAKIMTDSRGQFAFTSVPKNEYFVAVPHMATQDIFPIRITGNHSGSECKHPLWVSITSGMDNALTVTYQKRDR
jgi:hypothetical protein